MKHLLIIGGRGGGIIAALWARAASVDQQETVLDSRDLRDYRIILNCDLPIF